MQKRFYLDTSIWRDYFEDRSDGIRPLGEFAFRFLRECLERKIEIIVSDTNSLELRNYFSEEQIKEILSSFEAIIKKVFATPEQHKKAKEEWLERERRIPFNDILQAIIAKDNNAIFITRDKHFEELCCIVEAKKPEEVIFG